MISGSKVQTEAVKVRVTTEDYEIEGYMHIKPGGYQARISDLLNVKELHYIPITGATYRKVDQPDAPAQQAETLILRLDTIKMVVPVRTEAAANPMEQMGGYTTNIASPKL